MQPNRFAAVVAWLISLVFTTFFFASIGEQTVVYSMLEALLTQSLFTMGERPLWRWAFKRANGRFALMGLALTLADGIINAAGIYKGVPGLSNSGVAFMLSDAFNIPATIGKQSAFGIAFFIGCIVAGLAEYLWEME